jgi:hypothetical protein
VPLLLPQLPPLPLVLLKLLLKKRKLLKLKNPMMTWVSVYSIKQSEKFHKKLPHFAIHAS